MKNTNQSKAKQFLGKLAQTFQSYRKVKSDRLRYLRKMNKIFVSKKITTFDNSRTKNLQ
jgi:hypothetical protein